MESNGVSNIESALDLRVPDDARETLSRPVPAGLEELLFSEGGVGPGTLWATTALRLTSTEPVPPGLLAVGLPDERSVACLVCAPTSTAPVGSVIRWHLDAVPATRQGLALDSSLADYVETAATEEHYRIASIERMEQLAGEYEQRHVVTAKLPRAHELKTIRLASQNVIVGLAAVRHDLAFDGLAAPLWQTTEAAHVVTHEGNRALLAMTLAAAFQFGGTMEVRFDEHPQRVVPAALRQFARVRGIACGEADRRAITPAEARELLRACRPCGPQLEALLEREAGRPELSPERARWLLLAGTWSELELTFMLTCAPATARAVLAGGGDPLDRVARQAQTALCRAAIVLQTLRARLERRAEEDGDQATVVEDTDATIDVEVLAPGAAVFSGVDEIPWTDQVTASQRLLVVPRATPGIDDAHLARRLALEHDATPAVLAPKGAPRSDALDGVLALSAPDHAHDLDLRIESRMLAAAVARR
jgi:hypothetical protein